jgi:hypothetical protein
LKFSQPSTPYETTNYAMMSQSPVDDINKKQINRTYLQVKPNHNNSTPIAASITTSLVNSNVNNINEPNSTNDDKRRRSLSRSLRSLFGRSSTIDKKKRDPSTDSRNTFNTVQHDVQSGNI